MNKVLHVFHTPEDDLDSFEQTNSMSDVDGDAETEAFDTSGCSCSSDELEPDTTTPSEFKNVFSDNQVATFVFFPSVAKLSLHIVQCFTNWVCIQLNIVSFCLVFVLSCDCHFCFHFIFIFLVQLVVEKVDPRPTCSTKT